MNSGTLKGRGVVRGRARGEALILKEAFSFLGDVDLDTAVIIARGHEAEGVSMTGKIIFYPEAKGSSGGCAVLQTLARKGRGPAGIVNIRDADFNLVEGAILARIPLVAELEEDPRELIQTGDRVEIDGDRGTIRILRRMSDS